MRDILKNYKIFNIDGKKSRSKDFYGGVLKNRKFLMAKFLHSIKKPDDFVCPLCGSKTGKKFLEYNKYLLIECANCKLVSPNINFDLVSEGDLYDSSFAKKDVEKEILDTYSYRKKTYAPERLKYILEKIPDLSIKKINLLDVGCGPGYFLSHLKDLGVKYRGLELATFLVDICKKKGLNVEQAYLENEPRGHYNIITLFDVLEHITTPIKFFKSLNEKLQKGGYVLAYTPNIHSVAFLLMGNGQNNLYPFQHVAIYDLASLKYLANKTGFTIHSIDFY